MSDRDRLLLPMFLEGLNGQKHRNELRLDPKIKLMAEKAYAGMVKVGGQHEFFEGENGIIEPAWWNSYKGYMGESSLAALMGWHWAPIVGQRDPGYDFFEALRFDGKTLYWKIDSKTFDTTNSFRRKTVLLRWDGDLPKLPDRMIYLWCAYNADLDVAAPVGWMFSSEIHPEDERRVPWGSDMELGRERLHKMEELSTATWVPKAA